MIKNYLNIALRNLRRHRSYAFINIFGLAVGMVCCLLIALYVHYEGSYDRFHNQAKQIYRIYWHSGAPQTRTPHPMASTMTQDFPEVTSAVSVTPLWGPGLTRPAYSIRYQDQRFDEREILGVDSAFFDVFSFPVLRGDAKAALKQPGLILLTEAMAAKYFGDEDPLGHVLNVEDYGDLRVGAVLANVPANAHFHFDFLISYATMKQDSPGDSFFEWADFGHYNYIRLAEGADPATVEAKIPEWISQYFDVFDTPEDLEALSQGLIGFRLQRLIDIHLRSHLKWELEPTGNLAYVYIFSAAALLILLIACINFMNLATARSTERAREVGMRKALGATRRQLIVQFLGESILLSTVAILVAVALTEMTLPFFNEFAGTSLSLLGEDSLLLAVALVGIALFTGLVAGSYPAFFLSSFRPVQVLKGLFSTRGDGAVLRKVLVVFQFAISIMLIVGTLVVHNQLVYLQSQKLGFESEQVVVLPLKGESLRGQYETIIEVMGAHTDVVSVTAVSNVPGGRFNQNPIQWREDVDPQTVSELRVDYNFFETLQIEIVEGRGFSRAFPSDLESAFILNETAARLFDWQTPIGEELAWDDDDVIRHGTIIGVAKDFHFASLHQRVAPLIIQVRPAEFNDLLVRIRPERMAETIAFLEQQWILFHPGRTFEYSFLSHDFDVLYQSEKQVRSLFGAFSLLAILIACLGLLGLASFTAEQRAKEIGVRKVLGASVPQLLFLLLKDFTQLMLVALVIAAPLAYFVMDRWLQNFAYHLELGGGTFVLAGALAFVIALLAVSHQSIKAALANPVKALRYE